MPHQSLKVAAINHALGLTNTNELVQSAHDALNDGVYSYSLGELATIKHPTWSECVPLFESAMKELDLPILEPAEAIRSILEFQVIEMIEGTSTPEFVLSELSSVYSSFDMDWPEKVMQPDLEQLEVFLADYKEFSDYQLYLAYGGEEPLLPDQERIDRLNTNAIEHAEEWCRNRWGSAIDTTWITSSTLALANSIRENREFFLLPILADTLQEAGCIHEFILDHFRSNRPHENRCFFVDLLIESSTEMNPQ